jgi:hypothetical protein
MYTTYYDIEFKNRSAGMGKQCMMFFGNGYGVSILLGDRFYSNGVDTYEVAIMDDYENVCYSSGLTEDVLGHQSKEEVMEIIEIIANL